MSNQPEALRIAKSLEYASLTGECAAATEIRRLHAANVELVYALRHAVLSLAYASDHLPELDRAYETANAAIAKHGGQQCAASPTST